MKLVTWNIHSFVGCDGVESAERIAEAIHGMDPEITLLQEIDFRYLDPSALDMLRRSTDQNAFAAPALGDGDRWYGQILFSDFPFVEKCIHDLSVPGREPRRLIDVTIDTPEGLLRVLGTHLGLSRQERNIQFTRITEIAKQGAALPTVLAGDFNEWLPGGKLAHRLLGDDSASTPAFLRTFPSRFPLFPLDRVLTKPASLLSDWTLDRDARQASDHCALIAHLNMSR